MECSLNAHAWTMDNIVNSVMASTIRKFISHHILDDQIKNCYVMLSI